MTVGGKQIEVMGVISAEDYAKGRCFQDAIVEVPLEMTAQVPVRHQRSQLAKHFARPALKDATLRVSEPEGPVCKPRHDPNSPGTQLALYMKLTTESRNNIKFNNWHYLALHPTESQLKSRKTSPVFFLMCNSPVSVSISP